MLKSELRKSALLKRMAYSKSDLARLNFALLAQFTLLDFSVVNNLHIFLPITEKGEPDTFLMIDWLNQHHPDISIIISKSDFLINTMSNYVYKGREYLKKGKYNILEPMHDEPFTGKIDMCIIPLLAFDMRGHRVGYGRGFYDRFLASVPKTIKVGLCFDEAVSKITDVNPFDITLDQCVSPTKIYCFNQETADS